MPKNYASAPNEINQEQVRFRLQRLKIEHPDIWHAITGLKSHPPLMPFSAQIILPGIQVVGQSILNHSSSLHIPTDPYGVWEIVSVIIQFIEISCKTKPTGKDYIADLLISRNKRQTFFSVFESNSNKMTIKKDGDYSTNIDASAIGTTEWLDGDEFRVDILQADGVISDVGVFIRGYSNLKMVKKS